MTRRDSVQLFLLPPGPCSYLDGLTEQKAATVIARDMGHFAPFLIERGFRRSQKMFYRQQCKGCSACISARVRLRDFEVRGGFARTLRRNADITATIEPPVATMALYELFTRYLHSRHAGGGMTDMAYGDFKAMMEEFPDDTRFLVCRKEGVVVGIMLFDVTINGTSAVYSFFEPELESRSLGTFMILTLAAATLEMGKIYLYLGFWVKGSPKMTYKEKFQPLELYVQEKWIEYADYIAPARSPENKGE
ncbi:MAG: arginyltransferase [Micavibrio sp.]|nr:arginyltransferase [Micavibrio sp.]